jgi:hypothetical protein
MAMVDLEDDAGIEKEKQKERKNKKHIWCKICGRPKPCYDPECPHVHHCSCGTL